MSTTPGMRGIGQFLAIVCACGTIALAGEQTPAERAAKVLADSRAALGGAKLDSIKTLQANGRTRRVRGNNLVPIEFELLLELPDKYLRADEFPAEELDPTSSGFNGDALIQVPPPAAGPAGGRPMAMPGAAPGAAPGAPAPPAGRGPAPDPRRARVTTLKQDFTRLWLGLFASSPSAYPLTFSWAAIAEAPQGQADVLDVKGDGTFALRMFVDSKTKLPIMISWTTPPTNVMITAPGATVFGGVCPGTVITTLVGGVVQLTMIGSFVLLSTNIRSANVPSPFTSSTSAWPCGASAIAAHENVSG